MTEKLFAVRKEFHTLFNFDASVSEKYGDTLTPTVRYFADWVGKPGRFME